MLKQVQHDKNRQTCHPENVENEVVNRSFQVVQDLKKQIPKRVRNDKRKSLPSRGGCHVSDRRGLDIKVKPEKNKDPHLYLSKNVTFSHLFLGRVPGWGKRKKQLNN